MNNFRHANDLRDVHDLILVINAGSSSLKFQVHEAGPDHRLSLVVGGQVSGIALNSRHFASKTVTGHRWRIVHWRRQKRITSGLHKKFLHRGCGSYRQATHGSRTPHRMEGPTWCAVF